MKNNNIEKNDGIIQYFKDNQYLLLIISFAAILTYGYEITNWTISLDEELFSYISRQQSIRGWIGDGRWGIALLKAILPTYKVMPYWNAVLSIVVLVIASVILCYTMSIGMKNRSKTASICSALIFITMPLHSFYLAFDTYTLEVSIGYLAVILSGYFYILWLEKDRSIKNILFSLLLLIYSISVYQMLVAVYICLVCVGLIMYTLKIGENEDNKTKEIVKFIFQAIINLIISLAVYGIINYFLQQAIYRRENVYGYFRWGVQDTREVIQQVIRWLKILFFSPEVIFKESKILQLSYLLIFILAVYGFIKVKKYRWLYLLEIIGLNLSICIAIILMGGKMPQRTMQVIPVYCTCIVYIALCMLINIKMKQLLCGIIILITLYQSNYTVELFYSESNRYMQDIQLANRVVDRIEELNLGEGPDYPVVFVGTHQMDDTYLLTEGQFSTSLFGKGVHGRASSFMKILGHFYEEPSKEEIKEAELITTTMPQWPNEGSVALKENMIIVNFGLEQ